MSQTKHVILLSTAIRSIDFNEVLETSADTCRYSVDGTLTFVSYRSKLMPPSVREAAGDSPSYTSEDFVYILNTPEWCEPNPLDLEST